MQLADEARARSRAARLAMDSNWGREPSRQRRPEAQSARAGGGEQQRTPRERAVTNGQRARLRRKVAQVEGPAARLAWLAA
mmetsp:Transcript_19877/g.49036  ORF Transcript_19877/g.49036 Transcript_19877/m.49036 type:complete len:81 (+) Transcript_19877:206-448(+)